VFYGKIKNCYLMKQVIPAAGQLEIEGSERDGGKHGGIK
jgi:hypothetical protein